MRWRAALLSSVLLVAASAAVEGHSIYRWTDAQGQVHFGDEPPPGVRAERIHLGERAVNAPASTRIREIRCRDFRGALAQLEALDDVPADDPQWLAARELAQRRIAQWCDD